MKGRYKRAPIFWCPVCDRELVTDGKKCPVCHKRIDGQPDRKKSREIIREYDRGESGSY